MTDYYSRYLSGRRLQRVYEVAPPRVQQYLESEILHVLGRLRRGDTVLELGCGYGRVIFRIAERAASAVGIDVSYENLRTAQQLASPTFRCRFICADALATPFADESFDVMVCVQNGICAFGVDQRALLVEALRVTRKGGLLLFSTYTEQFWPDRLAWFETQAAHGLLGPIDYRATGNGTIVCTDGFQASRLTPEELLSLCQQVRVTPVIEEVDGSSLFCEIRR